MKRVHSGTRAREHPPLISLAAAQPRSFAFMLVPREHRFRPRMARMGTDARGSALPGKLVDDRIAGRPPGVVASTTGGFKADLTTAPESVFEANVNNMDTPPLFSWGWPKCAACCI